MLIAILPQDFLLFQDFLGEVGEVCSAFVTQSWEGLVVIRMEELT